MTQVNRSLATLRIMGDDLIPSEISIALKCKPTETQAKGEIITGKNIKSQRTARMGMWRLKAQEQEPENLDDQISELIGKLEQDLTIWKSLSDKYDIDLFCGLFLDESNEGMEISQTSLKALGDRGISLSLDIYDGNDQPLDQKDICPCGSGKSYGECCGANAA